ncbi:hypothetical protein Y695_02446 [Hydrogenophaga sp. T4]|nr:hypothetical protein Y695_02446 [Hydrogenophaga sp. T4]
MELPDGCGDTEYLEALERALEELEQRFYPGLVIYLAGAIRTRATGSGA